MTTKTPAARQAAWRARRKDEHARRLNAWLSLQGQVALERIARRHDLTREQMLERLIFAEDERLVMTLTPDTPAWGAYFSKPSCKRKPSATMAPDDSVTL
jgi:hypothetical protein